MRDQRVQVFRTAIDGLLESLESIVRLARWSDEEAAPEPLVSSASKIVDRLGVADRLASSRFNGPPTDVVRVGAMRDAMKRLDVAYRAYRQRAESPDDTSDALATLESEIAATSAGAPSWL
jgi:hypothetical protein